MAGDAENDVAICFVNENDYRKISAKAVSAKQKFKKSRASWLASKHCNDVDSSEAESSSEEDVQENGRPKSCTDQTQEHDVANVQKNP